MNFWNFLGAGVFGFIINLPIVNYYEHSTYLTVNHGHAALMGVYGNLALAAILFCSRIAGGALFVLGGVLPLAWVLITRSGHLKVDRPAISGASGGQAALAGVEQQLSAPTR